MRRQRSFYARENATSRRETLENCRARTTRFLELKKFNSIALQGCEIDSDIQPYEIGTPTDVVLQQVGMHHQAVPGDTLNVRFYPMSNGITELRFWRDKIQKADCKIATIDRR